MTTTLKERAIKASEERDVAAADRKRREQRRHQDSARAGIVTLAETKFDLTINPDHINDVGQIGATYDYDMGDDLVLRFNGTGRAQFAPVITANLLRPSNKPLRRNGLTAVGVHDLLTLGDALRKVDDLA